MSNPAEKFDHGTRASLHDELDQALDAFHQLLDGASPADLHRGTVGTRWTNEQLLFHMLFGYLIVRTLLPLVRTVSHLPPAASAAFATGLDAAHRPFHVVNYLGSCGGAIVFNHHRMAAKADRVVAALHRQLDAETDDDLARGMHFPPRWDPYFGDWMSVRDVYHYGTVHFQAHQRQLTLRQPTEPQPTT
ncbi:DinB family protein [Lapillicoccus sp.]|uniref:DinB family protein n=1 Tax=Lapillicoccus sp. TaxID=1909287 RepID=UPI0032646E0A